MTDFSPTDKPQASLKVVRERSCLSFERLHSRRSTKKRVLLLIDQQAAVNYFKDLVEYLAIQDQVVIAAISPESVIMVCQERCKKAGPFQRIYLIMLAKGQPSDPAYLACQQIRDFFPPPTNIHVGLLAYNPSFDLWILLHFEEPGPDANDAVWLKERVEQLLQNHAHINKLKHSSLFSQIIVFLDSAVQRGLKMARQRQLALATEMEFSNKPDTQIHILIPFLKQLANFNNSSSF